MSDTGNPFGFGKLVPGFDFLQNLVDSAVKGTGRGAGQAPGLAGWIAPTMNIEDLDKRIGELKAVSFWLDQNAKALQATIQALELQKMTLSTLKGMNLAMGDVAQAFRINPGTMGAAKADAAGAEPSSAKDAAKAYAKSFETLSASQPAEPQAAAPAPAEAESKPPAAAPAMVDPTQWWGALTSQFQQIAANAMQEAGRNPALDATRDMASNAMKAANEMTTSLTSATHGAKALATKKTAASKTAESAAKKPAAKSGKRAPAGG